MNWQIISLTTDVDSIVRHVEFDVYNNTARLRFGVDLDVKDPSDPDFIVYEELSPETVIAWVQSYLDKDMIESRVALRAEERSWTRNSTLPWGE